MIAKAHDQRQEDPLKESNVESMGDLHGLTDRKKKKKNCNIIFRGEWVWKKQGKLFFLQQSYLLPIIPIIIMQDCLDPRVVFVTNSIIFYESLGK